jgi:FdhD protein
MNKSKTHKSLLQEGEVLEEREETLVQERPLQIIVNDQEFSMTMQTPGDERYLIRGLLHSEGVKHTSFTEYEQSEEDNGTIAKVRIVCTKAIAGDRTLVSTSSCGLCGKTNLDSLFEEIDPVTKDAHLSATDIQSIFKNIAPHQTLFKKTGGCHAAAAINMQGETICVFEDIGRHNAVDKVIGYLLENKRLDDAAALTVSGRVSFEIIQKCARARIPFLCAISAPSSMAVETAEKWGITLAAFCRADRATFYSGLHRINKTPQPS